MEKDNEKTVVIFRRFYKKEDGDSVIAIFPEIPADQALCNCMSYEHIGQHGAASVFIHQWTKPALPDEYADLKTELEGLGYNLDIKKRMSWEYHERRKRSLGL